MKSRVLKLASLVLALMMVLTLFSACGKDTGNGSDEYEVEYEYEYVDENGNPITEGDSDTDDKDDKDDKDNSSKKTTTNNSSKKTAGGSGGKKNQTEVVVGKTKFEADPYSDIPESLKGTTVKVLLWRDPVGTDITLKEGFEAKTGIKVEYIIAKNGTYSSQLATLISSGDSPDVVNMDSNEFPGFAISSLEPLDKEVFRLEDPIWNKDLMECLKIKGNYYALAIPGNWYNDDTAYVTYYNPAGLQASGISAESMPYNLWKNGSWNIDKFEEIIRKVDSMGSGYTGLSIQSNTVPNPIMLAAGVDFIKYDGNEFSPNISNSTVIKMSEKLAKWYEDGLVCDFNTEGIQGKTVGLFTAIAYGMYNGGNWWSLIDASTLETVPVPGKYTPANPKVWGVAKGAKNTQGAAYFLRYFLDPASLDMASTFYNAKMYDVWKAVCNTTPSLNYTRGVFNYFSSGEYGTLTSKVTTTASAQIATVLGEYENTIMAACRRSNSDLKKALKKPSYVG